MRWKALFFLNPELKSKTFNTFGFRTEKSAPQIKEMMDFENELCGIISSNKFSIHRDSFQKMLSKDVKKVQNSKNIFILGDKTTNVYEVDPNDYKKTT